MVNLIAGNANRVSKIINVMAEPFVNARNNQLVESQEDPPSTKNKVLLKLMPEIWEKILMVGCQEKKGLYNFLYNFLLINTLCCRLVERVREAHIRDFLSSITAHAIFKKEALNKLQVLFLEKQAITLRVNSLRREIEQKQAEKISFIKKFNEEIIFIKLNLNRIELQASVDAIFNEDFFQKHLHSFLFRPQFTEFIKGLFAQKTVRGDPFKAIEIVLRVAKETARSKRHIHPTINKKEYAELGLDSCLEARLPSRPLSATYPHLGSIVEVGSHQFCESEVDAFRGHFIFYNLDKIFNEALPEVIPPYGTILVCDFA